MSDRSASPSSDGNFPFKNRSKKIRKKREEVSQKISEQGQSKITQFFRCSQKGCSQKIPKPFQLKIAYLQQQLNQLRCEEQALTYKKQCLIDQQIQSTQKLQSYMKQSRQIISQCLTSIHSISRKQKSKIDPLKGFYFKGTKQFIPGSYGIQCNNRIKLLKNQLRSDSITNKHQMQFLKQQLKKQQQKYIIIKQQINNYKEGLKLMMEEKVCTFANVWPLINHRYQTLHLLGKGGFSQVYKAYDLVKNIEIALKLSCLSAYLTSNSHYLTREYQIHQNLNHPNIAKLYEYMDCGQDRICIAIQFCQGPELSKYLKEKNILSQIQAKSIIKQVFQGLKYLSSLENKVIHYDLKPQNIMFHNGIIKILDFGLCKQMDNDNSRIALTNQGVGTYWYLPPEAFNQKNPQISNKVDVWSAGVIFYEMLFGRRPFGHNMTQNNVLKQGIILNAFEVQFPKDILVSQQAKQFLKGCLSYDLSKRYGPEQALSDAYFNQ